MLKALALTACLAAVTASAPSLGAPAPRPPLLFSPQDNQLDTYEIGDEEPQRNVFIPSAADGGKDLNGDVCVFGDRRHILLGEDTDQDKGIPQGWGVFDIKTRREIGKLIADYGPTEQPEQFGCAIETDLRGRLRRIFATQVGGGSFEASDGQLIVFFKSSPALDGLLHRGGDVCPRGDCSALTEADSRYCILDDDLRTGGGIAMDDEGNLYVAESAPRGPPDAPEPGRILRYSPPFPTSQGSCRQKEPETFIQDPRSATPADIAGAPGGNWYVSSVVFPPVVNEYDAHGDFVRTVVPPGHGTPFGLATAADGSLYFADIGIAIDPTAILQDPSRLGLGPKEGEGSIQMVRFDQGEPLPPVVLEDGLTYPDGLGILRPFSRGDPRVSNSTDRNRRLSRRT